MLTYINSDLSLQKCNLLNLHRYLDYKNVMALNQGHQCHILSYYLRGCKD